ncbi:universal stress protein [Candidatus Laterigemmans baculatus]|uniref:universal stress protein n=1 Tax=Candidatus Laterigemmans baculatus TaxID=2770505 RepID=UPI0013DBA9B4|nr:universal stress protein [Candidatus Laterigemmans baculatus]
MRIIIATDGSEDARQAACFFSRLPHDQPLEVSVVTVLDATEHYSSTPSEAWYPEYVEQQQALAERSYARVAEVFEGANARLRSVKLQGDPGEAIVQQAANDKTDLIVLGAKGHSAIERALLGSVSQFVATHADCSVLVVRPPAPGHELEETLRVTVAYDGSESSERAIEQFFRFKWGARVLVQILSIVHEYRSFRPEPTPPAMQQTAEVRRAMGEKAQAMAGRFQRGHIQTKSRVASADHVGEAIVTMAKEHRSHLVVVGSTGRRLLSRILLGSVTSFVMRHAKQSVWIGRQRKV